MFVKDTKQERVRTIFGYITEKEEKEIWREITRKAMQDQEEVMRKAEEKRKRWAKYGMTKREELERKGFIYPDSYPDYIASLENNTADIKTADTADLKTADLKVADR